MWLKYSDAPIIRSGFVHRPQPVEVHSHSKPNGCWITDETEDCWRAWCVAEDFGLERLTHKHEVVLDESNILILSSAIELDAFTHEFAAYRRWGPPSEPEKWIDKSINWKRVAQAYSGLIVTPYQWSRRLHDGYSWYYGWDCSSGCIWDLSAIIDIRLISVDRDIAGTKEAA